MPFTSPLSVNTSKMDGRKSDGVFAGHLRWKMLLTVLFILNLMTSPLANEFTAPENVYIGVILENAVESDQNIINLAFDQIRHDHRLLPHSNFKFISRTLTSVDPFEAVKLACYMLDNNVTAILSSTSCKTSLALQSFAENVGIPHMMAPLERCPLQKPDGLTLSIVPNASSVSTATFQLMSELPSWENCSIFYDSDGAYKNVEEVLHLAVDSSSPPLVRLFRIDSTDTGSDTSIIRSLHVAKDSGVTNFLVFCNMATSMRLIMQAALFGMTVRDYRWIVTSQEWRDVLVSPSHEATINETRKFMRGIKFFNGTTGILALCKQNVTIHQHNNNFKEAWLTLNPELSDMFENNKTELGIDTLMDINYHGAYMYDAVWALANAIHDVIKKNRFQEPQFASCMETFLELETPKSRGNRIRRALSKVDDMQGLLGIVRFNESGYNAEYNMDIMSVESRNNVTTSWRIGTWNSSDNLTLLQTPFTKSLRAMNKTYTIVTIAEAPFVSVDDTVNGPKFSGFCIDMLNYIAKELDFEYKLYLTPDEKYGGQNLDNTWNGLVGEVYYGRADMAVAGMIINSHREEVVDFTKPYMNYGVGILMRNPNKKANPFAFLEPLDITVWGCVSAALVIVGFLIFILDRLSPYSLYGRSGGEIGYDEFDLKNSMWFAFASCMQQVSVTLNSKSNWNLDMEENPNQGGDSTPISMSGRILSAFWWFFALIITATYTANLAAFLTVTRMENPITSLDDLARQSVVVYGTIENSSLHRFFEQRKEESPYDMMWSQMNKAGVDPWVKTAENGYNRVKTEKYAFFWDAPILDYIKQTECDLMTVGKPFNLKGYGIATPQDVPYTDDLSMVILKMQEKGIIEEYRKRWFLKDSQCREEQKSDANTKADAIQLQTIGGAFYVLMMGGILAFVAVFIEHVWHKPSFYRKKRKELKGNREREWAEKLQGARNNGMIAECSSAKLMTDTDPMSLQPLRSNPWNVAESSC
ncbi:glutamate receptor ionotropic, delta-2-like isoform X3 [Apostichopus japonicus]|uniref:glutamate receptor ionotropic, delta-2-like isoform X3 n=1 Tax=Stichopus japonicus TaxID=307972 RepID=UPI003AB8810D